jgi:hypothetical protein
MTVEHEPWNDELAEAAVDEEMARQPPTNEECCLMDGFREAYNLGEGTAFMEAHPELWPLLLRLTAVQLRKQLQ